MQITDELIQKFLLNRCTTSEAAAVAKYLKKHPALLAVYLRPSWEASSGKGILPLNYSADMLSEIQKGIRNKQAARRKIIRSMAVAASIIAVLVTGWIYSKYGSSNAEQRSLASLHKANPGNWKVITNRTGIAYTIILKDSSVVTLAAKATIRYMEPFAARDRNVYLTGEAAFVAAKDKLHPFTVHAGLFSTTALGTSFSVRENDRGYRVKLFTGKVVIRPTGPYVPGWKSDVFLQPGQQMKYDPVKKRVTVTLVNTRPEASVHHASNGGIESNTEKLVFDNTPLPEVMKKLEGKYNLSIEYNKDQLTGMYFSGEVLKDDSLFVLLKVIAQMNALSVTEKPGGFIISKIK